MIQRIYKNVALILFNSLLIFLLINFIAWLILFFVKEPDTNSESIYTLANFQKVYPYYNAKEIDDLLTETHTRGFVYDPYQGYREAPFKGKYVNVSELGYRYNGADQPDINDSSIIPIFLFGGSTTFGYGVSDSLTIGAYLDRRVKRKNHSYCIYNFGAGGYFSNQEFIYFKRALAIKNKPAIAIFLDGLNEFKIKGDDPLFAGSIRRLLRNMKLTEDPGDAKMKETYLAKMPVMQLYFRWIMPHNNVHDQKPANTDPGEIDGIISRYKANCMAENALAKLYGVKTIFIIQPVPQYDYDLRYHVFKNDPRLEDLFIRVGYDRIKRLSVDTSVYWLWLGQMQHDIKKNLYVDDVHYTPEMDSLIADAIFQKIDGMISLPNAER